MTASRPNVSSGRLLTVRNTRVSSVARSVNSKMYLNVCHRRMSAGVEKQWPQRTGSHTTHHSTSAPPLTAGGSHRSGISVVDATPTWNCWGALGVVASTSVTTSSHGPSAWGPAPTSLMAFTRMLPTRALERSGGCTSPVPMVYPGVSDPTRTTYCTCAHTRGAASQPQPH